MTTAFGLSLAVWNAWVLVWWIVRFHPQPRAILDAFPANLPWRDFSLAVFAANWAGFLAAAAAAAGLIAIARRTGRRAAGWFRWGGGEGVPLAFGLGLGIGGSAILGLGFTGLLIAPPRWAACLALGAIAAADAGRLHATGRAAWGGLVRDLWTPFSPALRAVVALSGLIVVLNLFNLELGWDALTYHLRLPAFYLIRHRVYDVWHHYCASFPAQGEMAWTAGLAAGGESAVRFLNFAAGIAWLLAAGALARRASVPPWLAVGICAASPTFLNLLTRAYIDLVFALFAALSLVALIRWHETGSRAALAVSGVFAGYAMGSKYVGVLVVAGAAAAAVASTPGRGLSSARAAAGWGAAALVPLAPWLAKNWLFTGNPVQPFLGGLFGTATAWSQQILPGASLATGLPGRAEALLANFGSINGPLVALAAGLAPLLAIPGGSGARGIARRASLGYLAGWFVLCPDARFFLPALPWLAVAVAGLAAEAAARRRAARVAIEVALAAGCLYAAGIQWQFYAPGTIPLGLVAPEERLRRVLAPPPYSGYAADAMNARVPLGARVLWLCHFNTYYVNRECIADFHFGVAHATRIAREGRTAEGQAKRLRQLGIDWLVSTGTGAVQYLGVPGFFAAPEAAWGEWRRLFSERMDLVWQTCEYTLFRVAPPHPARPLPVLPICEPLVLRAADAALAAGRPAEALAVFSAPPALVRGVGAVAAREGEALALLGRFPEAIKAYARALATGLDTPRLQADLALALLREGKPVEALAPAEEAWRQDPRSAQTAAALAGIHATLGHLPDARSWIALARRLDPGNAAWDDLAARIGGLQ